jgi:hypothetical protein
VGAAASGVDIVMPTHQQRHPARTTLPQARSILSKAVLPSNDRGVAESLADNHREGYLRRARYPDSSPGP